MSIITSLVSSTTSSLGPLMTTFTPPSSCDDVLLAACGVSETTVTPTSGIPFVNTYTRCAYLERGRTCASSGSYGYATYASECYPDSPPSPWSLLQYSSATACPAGYSTNGQIIDSTSVTTAICCPSGYSTYSESCTRSFTESTMNVISCPSSGSPVSVVVSSWEEFGGVTTSFSHMYAVQIQVVFPTSLSSLSFTTPDEPTSSPSTPINETPGDANTLETPSGSKERSGLGGGAIAGIVVGAVAALVLAGAAAFFWRRRKHRRMPGSKGSPGGEQDILPEYVGGSGTTGAPPQMGATSNGLFQPQPAPGSTR